MKPTPEDLRSWGLDPAWSRVLEVKTQHGTTWQWHVLDTATENAESTIVCVHGNPTWAYAWKSFLVGLGARHRVIAVDQLGMGFSDRTPQRRFAERVRDLDDILAALDIDPSLPLILAAHDWGGAISMGWAVDHVDRLAGMILCNTGISVPDGREAPRIIRLAASAPLLDAVCRATPLFVEGTTRLSRGRLTAVDRAAFRAPYRSAPSRSAIADFVDDIPLRQDHPSAAALAAVADRLQDIDVPVLLAWGARDPVFNDDFAADLIARLPNTSLHRFARANHLVMAEADVASVASSWIEGLIHPSDRVPESTPSGDHRHLWEAIEAHRGDGSTAFVDVATGDRLSWSELGERVDAVAAGLIAGGLQPGDRVAMLTPPGIDLVAAVYGVWRAGGVTVVADRGLGVRGLRTAVRSARPRWVVGPKRALRATAILGFAPGAGPVEIGSLLARRATTSEAIATPTPSDAAAIVFTSGATGPAKGVRYTHQQLGAQRDALAATYGVAPTDRLVAAFAPFALYGPALGIPTAIPACDVTKPSSLTAVMLDDACAAIGATMAFGSPSALANVVRTSATRSRWNGISVLRLVMSAGAPVPAETLRAFAELAPHAELHTPYGMTEVLPVADIELDEIEAAEKETVGASDVGGVCVGVPVAGSRVVILPLGFDALSPPPPIGVGEMGEIVVCAPWVSDGYLDLWLTEHQARPVIDFETWHRSGDVGHVDARGRLWVEGRAVHVISTVDGFVTPVPIERAIETHGTCTRCAAVGVGPSGRQQLVIVVEDPDGSDGLAEDAMAASVRSTVGRPVAAVLVKRSLPVDIRHNAKIDRTAVAEWASDVLAGRHRRVRRR